MNFMLFSIDHVSTLWALVWVWVMENYPILVVGLRMVVLALQVVFLASKTIARAFCQHHDTSDSLGGGLPVAVSRHDSTAKVLYGVAPPIAMLCSGVDVLEEGPPEQSHPSTFEVMFPNNQPLLCHDDLRLLRMLKAMYVILYQTLDGATNSLSTGERMMTACSLVSRTVATFRGWHASAAVVTLLQPAKDMTESFSRLSIKNDGSGAMNEARQAHFVAVLKKRADTMQEVLSQALWAGTMPIVPTDVRGAISKNAATEKLGTCGKKTSTTARQPGRKGKTAIASGVPCSRAFRLGKNSMLQ